MAPSTTVARYLFNRLHQLGIRALHGVPGDFNLTALDHVEKCGLKWVGNANELNAGYAADGYARIKGIGAVLTTFGVGELSATNAVAGSRADNVPVVHIVGTPSTKSQKAGSILHHTFGNGNFNAFKEISERLTVAQANLWDPKKAPADIDRVLRECWIQSRPVYIQLPTDMVNKPVDRSALDDPVDLSYPTNDKDLETSTADLILKRLYEAQQPVLLIDGCVRRNRLIPVVDMLVRESKLPTFVTPVGKSLVNEEVENFCGVYSGDGSSDTVREHVNSSDCVVSIGGLQSDYNTLGFTYRIQDQNLVDLHTDTSFVNGAKFDVHLGGLLQSIISRMVPSKLKTSSVKLAHSKSDVLQMKEKYPAQTITQEYLWSKLSDWLQPNDILITDTGTAYLGVWDTQLKGGMTSISQPMWSSIGYALPAAQGAAMAAKKLGSNQRIILFQGDGSFQMTAQSISDSIRHKLDMIIFLLSNNGSTIERWIHGMDAGYNDNPKWRYTEIPKAMGAGKDSVQTFKVSTKEQIEALWRDEEFANGKGLRFVEVQMPRDDAPIVLKKFAAAAAKTNAN